MKTVLGLYESMETGEEAVDELMEAGFPEEEISVIAREDVVKERLAGDRSQQVAETAGAGAVGGSALGGFIGLIAGASAIFVPGVGPALAAGTLATVLGTTAAGAGIGALYGGFVGSLIGLGISEEEAHLFVEGVKRGNILVLVETEDRRAPEAQKIMRKAKAIAMDTRKET